jgi:hypothetical protein
VYDLLLMRNRDMICTHAQKEYDFMFMRRSDMTYYSCAARI